MNDDILQICDYFFSELNSHDISIADSCNGLYTYPQIPQNIIDAAIRRLNGVEPDDIILIFDYDDHLLKGRDGDEFSVLTINNILIPGLHPINVFDVNSIECDNFIKINGFIFGIIDDDKIGEFLHHLLDSIIKILKAINTKESDISYKYKKAETHTNDIVLEFSETLIFMLALSKGYSVLMLNLLREHTSDAVLMLISSIPFIGRKLEKKLSGKPIELISQALSYYGEPFIIQKLMPVWNYMGYDYSVLTSSITDAPDFVFGNEIKEQSIDTLKKYFSINECETNSFKNKEFNFNTSHMNCSQETQHANINMETRLSLLKDLASLYQSGILTEEEFQMQKKLLIG